MFTPQWIGNLCDELQHGAVLIDIWAIEMGGAVHGIRAPLVLGAQAENDEAVVKVDDIGGLSNDI